MVRRRTTYFRYGSEYEHLERLKKNANCDDKIAIVLGTRRIFVYGAGEAEKQLITSLRDRFANSGDNYVYEFELDFYDCLTEPVGVKAGIGLKEILYWASYPQSKVGELYLRTDNGNESFYIKGRREKELQEALKDICAMEKINANLSIKTNLRL